MKKQIIYIIGLWMISLTVYGQVPHILTEGDVTFSDGEITDYTSKYVNIIIPEYLYGQEVTSIGSYSFARSSLISVEIPNSVTSIGEQAFFDNILTSIIIPNSVTSIESSAFSKNYLTSIEIPNSVISIGSSAFSDNLLTEVTIPNSVTHIESYTFSENRLTEVTIPNSVISIGSSAFSDNLLTEVTIPNSVTDIESYAFSDNSLTEVTIPNSVIFIEYSAFSDNSLTSFILPEPTAEGAWNEGTAGEAVSDMSIKYIYQLTAYTAVDSDFLFEDGEIKDYYGPAAALTIPASIDGQTVVSIGNAAFKSKGLSSVEIPNTVTSIGSEAFAYNDLTHVDIPNSLVSLAYRSFAYNSLASVTIPNSVTSIGNAAFWVNDLTSVDIPNSVTYIHLNAFNNNNLTSFVLPEPTMAGAWDEGTAGQATSDLTTSYTYEATGYTAVDADFLFDNGEIQDYYGPGGELIIPSMIDGQTVTAIGASAFYGNGLTSVTIPNSVTAIERNAFQSNNLTSVEIGNSVVSIGLYAFYDNDLISVDIPNSVTSIDDYAFRNNSLTSLTLSNSLTYIGNYAFGNNSLTSVEIPNSVVSFGDGAFRDNSLTSLTISNSVTYIGSSAFYGNNLSSVDIPNSVTYIGSSAFRENTLTSFVLPEPTVSGAWNEGTAGNATSDLSSIYVYVLSDRSAVYTPEDSDFLFEDGEIQDYYGLGGEIIIPATIDGQMVTAIGTNAFYGNNLFSVEIPNTVTSIGESAFRYNYFMTSVEIPDSVISIGKNAFASCGFTSVKIGNSVISIGESAFEGNSLISVEIGNSVVTIGESAFEDNSLTSLEMPNSITTIGASAFYNNSLTSLVISNSVITIGSTAFFNNSLVEVTIPNSVIAIGSSAFSSNSLTSVELPNSVITIGSSAFSGNSLTSVELPNSVVSIGENAFKDNLLTSIEIPNSVAYIGDAAFDSNILTSFILPQSSATGFEVDGWIASGNGTTYAAGETTPNIHWAYTLVLLENNSAIVSVLFEDGTGDLSVSGDLTKNYTGIASANFFVDQGSDITLTPEASDLGYEFLPESVSLTDIQEDVSQVFTYSASTYSITYELGEGTHDNPATYTVESDTITLSAAVREGYEFVGWYSDASFTTVITEIALGSTGDITIYAKWEEIQSEEEPLSIENDLVGVTIYPNPSVTGLFYVDLAEGDFSTIRVFDTSGHLLVEQEKNLTLSSEVSVSLGTGMYIMQISSAGKNYRQKIIIR